MLSKADNELLTRTGPGTPMGALFRRFWLPALLAKELPAPDCPPIVFGLLSERLVAFRDTSGKVGVLEARCPHRHASLYWGRNEEGGLRCAYHGWKFATDGSCLDQPAEPEYSKFRESIRAVAYDTHEAGGIIWVYMGPKELRPGFPELEWTLLPDDHFLATKRLQQCNYLQNLEGEVDTAHVNFLHRSRSDDRALPAQHLPPRMDDSMLPPGFLARKQFLLTETGFGLVAMARSEFPDDEYYWRMTPFVLPSSTLIPAPIGAANTWTSAVPIDDTHMWGFTATWHPERPLNEQETLGVTSGAGVHSIVDETTWLPLANMGNEYLMDREVQSTKNFTGIFGVRNQDLAVQEDQDGPICQRHEEHLGVSDRGIVGVRRMLLSLVKQLENGIEPSQPRNPAAFRIRSAAITAPQHVSPVELFLAAQPETFDATTVGSAT